MFLGLITGGRLLGIRRNSRGHWKRGADVGSTVAQRVRPAFVTLRSGVVPGDNAHRRRGRMDESNSQDWSPAPNLAQAAVADRNVGNPVIKNHIEKCRSEQHQVGENRPLGDTRKSC